jgi:general secretion pathway protein G
MHRPAARRQGGFTLVELLVVITIIGIIGTVVTVNVIGHVAEAKRVKAKEMIVQIKGALDAYRLHNGSYPSEGEGLQKLTEPSKKMGDEPYIKRIPKDPFGEEFIYNLEGRSDIDIICKGEDLQEGTEDDISWRKIEEQEE